VGWHANVTWWSGAPPAVHRFKAVSYRRVAASLTNSSLTVALNTLKEAKALPGIGKGSLDTVRPTVMLLSSLSLSAEPFAGHPHSRVLWRQQLGTQEHKVLTC